MTAFESRHHRWSRVGALAAATGAVVALAACSGSTARTQTTSPSSAASSPVPPASSSVTSASAPAPPPSSVPVATSSAPAAPNAAGLAGFSPASVTFVSAGTGYVLGQLPCTSTVCYALAKTVDGGRDWSPVSDLPMRPQQDQPVTAVRFADVNDGWVFGPQLWATHDGGRSWRRLPQTSAVTDVEASGGVVYASVGGKLLRSPVGTDAFAPVVGAPAGVQQIVLHGSAAWLRGQSAQGASYAVSTDGVHWNSVPDPCAGQAAGPWSLAGVAPVTDSDVFLLCAGDAGAGSVSKKVLYSTDGGLHAAPTAADPPRGGDVTGFAAASSSVVAISAASGASWIYRSADSGRSWNASLQQGDGGIGYRDLGFTTATQGVAIYGTPGAANPSRLLMTRDAGASWAAVSF